MQIKAESPEHYINQLPEDRKAVMFKLRETILDNLPEGFVESMNYGTIGYVIPHSLYPNGYHCNPELPLPFMNIASQKNYIAIYHMGIYGNKELSAWFIKEYNKHFKRKLDMGKGCIRFRKIDEIPYKLIGELSAKINPADWINIYETNIKR